MPPKNSLIPKSMTQNSGPGLGTDTHGCFSSLVSLVQAIWGRDREYTFLTNSQVMLLMLLVDEPHFGNQILIAKEGSRG